MPGREPIENIKFAFATMRHQPGTSQHHPWIFKSKFGSGLLSGSERGDVCIGTDGITVQGIRDNYCIQSLDNPTVSYRS